MKGLNRDKIDITYWLYTGLTEETDADGNYTGEKPPTYSDPVTIKANVSAAKGTVDIQLFGVDESYTNTVIVDDLTCPIDENSRLEIKGKPYAVIRVAKSFNHITYAVKLLTETAELRVPIVSL